MREKQQSGFLLIDKPAGLSSFDVIRQLRRQTGIRTFGHAGTLDPFATGLLIIAVNKYTRLLSLLDDTDKVYLAELILGQETATGDPEGDIIKTDDHPVDKSKLADLDKAVLDITHLKPPIYSAIKVNGKKAYDRARANEDFELPERESRIHEFKILKYDYPIMEFFCKVSKGTYIRSLSRWIADFLGTIGYTKSLRRTAIGNISVQNALQLEAINAETLSGQLVSVLDILPGLERVNLNEAQLKLIRNGNSINLQGSDNATILVFDDTAECVGIAFRKDNKLSPRVNL